MKLRATTASLSLCTNIFIPRLTLRAGSTRAGIGYRGTRNIVLNYLNVERTVRILTTRRQWGWRGRPVYCKPFSSVGHPAKRIVD
jgi:hypothetical protein